MEYVLRFLDGTGPRVFNSKIDNSLLGVTNISGLLKEHDTPVEDLNVPALRRKLGKAQRKLKLKWKAYQKLFIRDRNRKVHVLRPRVGTTKDGIGHAGADGTGVAESKEATDRADERGCRLVTNLVIYSLESLWALASYCMAPYEYG